MSCDFFESLSLSWSSCMSYALPCARSGLFYTGARSEEGYVPRQPEGDKTACEQLGGPRFPCACSSCLSPSSLRLLRLGRARGTASLRPFGLYLSSSLFAHDSPNSFLGNARLSRPLLSRGRRQSQLAALPGDLDLPPTDQTPRASNLWAPCPARWIPVPASLSSPTTQG